MPNLSVLNNLKLWIDANTVTQNTIVDQSGQTGDWSLNNTQLINNAVNNLSSIRFISNNSSIVAPNSVGFSNFNFMHNSQTHIFGVIKLGLFNRLSSISRNALLISTYSDNSPGPGYRLFLGTNAKRGSGITAHITKGSSGIYTVGLSTFGQIVNNNWYIFHIYTDPSFSAAADRGYITIGNMSYANNRFIETSSSSNSNSILRIFSSSDDTNGDFGELGELLIYNGSMNATEIFNVKDYLATKWDLSEKIIPPTPTPTPTVTKTPTPTPTNTLTPTPSSSPDSIKYIINSTTKCSIPNITDFDIDVLRSRYFYITSRSTVAAVSMVDNKVLQFSTALARDARSCAYDSTNNRLFVGVNNNSNTGTNSVVECLNADNFSRISTNSQAITDIPSPIATKLLVSSQYNKVYGRVVRSTSESSSVQKVIAWNTTNLSSYTTILTSASRIHDIVLDEPNDKLYISANVNNVNKIYQVSLSTNAILQSWDIYATSLCVSGNLLMYTSDDTVYFMTLNNQTVLSSYKLHSQTNRFIVNGPYTLAYDSENNNLYVFDNRPRDNQPKFLLFNTNTYQYIGVYGFTADAELRTGVSSAKYVPGFRKVLARSGNQYLYSICPENMVINSLFSRQVLPGKCNASTGSIGIADTVANSISPWISSNANVISMSYCNRIEAYNPFVSLGPASGSGYIEQTFSTASGYDYLVEFQLGNAPGFSTTADKIARVILTNENNQNIYDQLFSTPAVTTSTRYNSLGWQAKSFVFTANSSATKIRFASPNPLLSSGGAAIDRVIITRSTYVPSPLPTPTPSPSNPGDQSNVLSNLTFSIRTFREFSGPRLSKTLPSFYGGVLTDDENVVFIPFSSNTIGLYNVDNNVYNDGPVHAKGASSFAGGALYGNNVIMIPFNSTNIGIYDVGKNYYSDGPTASGFLGGVLTKQDILVMSPYASSRVGLYNPATNSYTAGPVHNQGSNAVFAGAVSIGDDKVLLVPNNSLNIGIYDASNNTYTSGPAHGAGSSAYFGGVLVPSLNRVILVPQNASNIGIYNINTNTITAGPAHNQGTSAFAGGVLLPNNNVLLIPSNAGYYGIYNTATNTYSNGPRSTSTTAKFVGGLLVNGSTVLPCPANSNIITYIGFGATSIPGSALRSRLINKL